MTKGTTREHTRAAAWRLIEQGISPSRLKIREEIGPGGSDVTVSDELSNFWSELGVFVSNARSAPEIPGEFIEAFNAIVNQARAFAASEWDRQREQFQRELAEKCLEAENLSTNLSETKKALSVLQQDLGVALAKISDLEASIADSEKALSVVSKDLANAREDKTNIKAQLAETKKEKAAEIELAYARSRETEERLTKLYDDQRIEREQALKELSVANSKMREFEASTSRLDEQNQFLGKQLHALEKTAIEFDLVKVTLKHTERDRDVALSEAANATKREKELSEKLALVEKERVKLEIATATHAAENERFKHEIQELVKKNQEIGSSVET